MKRMLAAIALALILHAAVFLAGADWFRNVTVPPQVLRFVNVTMSYRHKPVQEAASEKKTQTSTNKSSPQPNGRTTDNVQGRTRHNHVFLCEGEQGGQLDQWHTKQREQKPRVG